MVVKRVLFDKFSLFYILYFYRVFLDLPKAIIMEFNLLRMQELTVGTSRSSTLNVPHLTVVPGGRLISNLLPAAKKAIETFRAKDQATILLYIVGGLPDVTERIKDKNYEEIIFPTHEDPDMTSARIINDIETFYSTILYKYTNTFPIFSTIGSQSLQTWNNHRHRTNKTTYLLHAHQYADMQTFLEHSIHIVNCHIKQVNDRHNFTTPNFARFITKDENLNDDSPKGLGRPKYGRLSDGCHLKSEKANQWRSHFLDVCQDNREIVLNWQYNV